MLTTVTSMWGLAALNSYMAYNDSKSLDLAKAMWDYTYPYFITPENAASGSHPKRNVTINKVCNGGQSLLHRPLSHIQINDIALFHSDRCGRCVGGDYTLLLSYL